MPKYLKTILVGLGMIALGGFLCLLDGNGNPWDGTDGGELWIYAPAAVGLGVYVVWYGVREYQKENNNDSDRNES